MTTITLTVPDDISTEEAQLTLAMGLFQSKRLSLGQAAKLAGYRKTAFMDALGRRGIPVIQYGPEELLEDLKVVIPPGK